MSFAGHALDMINRVKYNRSLLLARRERISNLRELYTDSHIYKNFSFHEKKLTLEQREKIKSDIRQKIKRENIRGTILTFLTMILLFTFISIIVYFVSNKN